MAIKFDTSYTEANKSLREICKPLFELTFINYVEFEQWFSNGDTISILTSNYELASAYLVEEVYPTQSFFEANSSRYVFMCSDCDLPLAVQGKHSSRFESNIQLVEQFSISQRFYIIEYISQLDAVQLCGFVTSSRVPAFVEKMTSMLDVLENYYQYIIVRLEGQIKKLHNNKRLS